MIFESPQRLLLLVLVPLVLLGYLLARRRARYAIRFPATGVLAGVVERTVPWRRWVSVGLYLLALTVMLLGVARPQATVAVPKEQVTVLLVMDVSGSMNATDMRPSRIEAARRSATAFVDALPRTFPIGIVAFNEGADVLLPPTTDRSEILETIAHLQAYGGTAMGDGINQALELRPGGPTAPPPPPGHNPNAIMLLESDGATTTGSDPMQAAERARRLRIPVHTIGVGTLEGKLPQLSGSRIPVPPDLPTLRRVSAHTGGRFFHAPTEEELGGIYQELGSQIGFRKQPQEVTVVIVAAALLLLLASATTSMIWTSRLP